jgi:tetratricopeptide (TPR) repeat protein
VTAAYEKNEPIWKGFVSWQAGFAVLSLAGFLFTIINPDKVPSNAAPADRVVKDLNLVTEAVLEDVKNKAPMKLLTAGKNLDAIAAAEKQSKARPWDIKTMMVAGDVYCEAPEGDKDKGLSLLKKSVAMCPESRYIRINYARHLAAANKLDEAVTQYELLDKSTTEEWTPMRIELANVYLAKSEFAKAVDTLKKVMQNDTKNGAAQELLGLAMARNNDDEGVEEFSKGFAVRKVQNQLTELNDYLAKHNNSKSASEASLTKEVKENPENQSNVILLGELLLLENKTKAAKDLLATN